MQGDPLHPERQRAVLVQPALPLAVGGGVLPDVPHVLDLGSCLRKAASALEAFPRTQLLGPVARIEQLVQRKGEEVPVDRLMRPASRMLPLVVIRSSWSCTAVRQKSIQPPWQYTLTSCSFGVRNDGGSPSSDISRQHRSRRRRRE